MSPPPLSLLDERWVTLGPPSISMGDCYPFSLYAQPNTADVPVLHGGQVATAAFIQRFCRVPLYFKRSMLSAYARYLDGRVCRFGFESEERLDWLVESGRLALSALFDQPHAPEHLLLSQRWTQRLLRVPGDLAWARLRPHAPRGTDMIDASVRCALFVAALGRSGRWAEASQQELCWAALIHALGRTLTSTHSSQDELQTLLPLVTANGPISAQLYGALCAFRERRDGSGPAGLRDDQVSPAAAYLGGAIHLEKSGFLITPVAETHRYLTENESHLVSLFGRTALEGIISSVMP